MNFRRMKKSVNIIVLIIVIGLINACTSSMTVKVDVFDRYKMEQSLEYQYFQTQNFQRSIEMQLSDGFFTRVDLFLDSVVNDYLNLMVQKKIINEGTRLSIEKTARDTISIALNAYKLRLIAALEKLKSNEESSFLNGQQIFWNARGDFDHFVNSLRQELEEDGVGKDDAIKLIQASENFIDKQESAYGISIMNDPMASFVAKSPKKYWTKYKPSFYKDDVENAKEEKSSLRMARVNKTSVRTFLGNSDIAIKMDQPGIFVVKGARVDADEAIKASFDVLNQGIKYMAYASGVPVPSSEGGKVKIPELEENDRLVRKNSMLKQNSDTQTKIFISTLLSMEGNYHDTTNVEMMKKSFETYKQFLPKE